MAGETIALQAGQNIPQFGPDYNALANMQRTQVYVQQAQQQVQADNALRAFYSDPSNFDMKTGQPVPTRFNALSAVSPIAGEHVQKNYLDFQAKQQQAQSFKSENVQRWVKLSEQGAEDIYATYAQRMKSGVDAKTANDMAAKEYDNLYKGLVESGMPPGLQQMWNRSWDPQRVSGNIETRKRMAALEKEQLGIKKAEQDLQYGGYQKTDVQTPSGPQTVYSSPIPGQPPRTLGGEVIPEGASARAGVPARDKPDEQLIVDTPDKKDVPAFLGPDNRYRDQNNKPLEDVTNPRKVGSAATAGAALSADAIKQVADQYQAGDKSALQGLGWGAVGSANRAAVRDELARRGVSGADLAAATAEYGGTQAAERTLGVRTANLGVALNEAKAFLPMGVAASDKVDRSQFPNLNSVILAVEKGTGNEDVIRLAVATNAISNAYAQVAARGGQSTDKARDQAREILNNAYTKGQYATAADQMMKEVEQAQGAPSAVRSEIRRGITGATPTDKTSAEAPIQPAKTETLPAAAAQALKEGVPTTFRNGQVWMLENGQPKRVQ